MAFASRVAADRPLSELNTTPLIDVMLVLLVMMILSVPVAVNSLEFNLPGDGPVTIQPDKVRNRIDISPGDTIRYNGTAVSRAQLAAILRREAAMTPEPQLEFAPEPTASYNASAEILRLVKASGVTNFGFVGNEKYREFDRER